MPRKKNSRNNRNPSSKTNSSKRKFELQDGETIDQCLERIAKEGYRPIRRTEEPIFAEVSENGETSYQPVDRTIIFEAVPAKHEH
ncbi:NETI motif-containing protein [Virgibacillus senegalensis]|uniref:NETI motif-containing protein n=1 Tax=Virgibacillus senegalensis TaxID=1499679 RepID=UPI00069D02CA|nr:NETI motif-containing protein [Virgibacillus senegalensis]